jgi:NAD(P)-dependent dehydrogenase (short-subunit alcohol dehydrogenase family)
MKKLSGKTALITGGNSGIGLAAARLFTEEGARVAVTGRDQATLDKAKLEMAELLAIQSDASDVRQIDALMKKIGERFGKLDVLFVNAASDRVSPFEYVAEPHFDESIAINFKGVFFTIQKALPLLANGASVIVTTSISNNFGAPNFSLYAACKAATRSLVQTLSQELAPRGIRVNAVSPGPTDTPGFGRWGDVPKELVDAARAEFTRRSPMKRFATSEEVAKAALFLAGPDASYCLGTELVVDGGFSSLF